MRFSLLLILAISSFSAFKLTGGGLSGNEALSQAAKTVNRVAERATPAVVSIAAIKRPLETAPISALGLGSGLIIRPEGWILTNHHVVENASRLTVAIDEKRKAIAHFVASDPKTDLAVLRIDGKFKDLPSLPLGNSDQIKVGDWAIAIGSPFGLSHSVSFGIISAKGRAQMGILDTEDFIQTDASINPGSSGGPLLNSAGEVVGINTAIFSQDGGNIGIGFAIPAKIARDVAEQLIAHGRVIRGWMGISAQDLNPDLARHFGVPSGEDSAQGALISDVFESSPGKKAGLRAGDVITRFDGKRVVDASDLKSLVGATDPGKDIEIAFIRNGESRLTLAHVLEAPFTPQQAGQAAPSHESRLGLVLQDPPSKIANFLKLGRGEGAIVTQVLPGSLAFDAGILPGDVILKLDQAPVRSARELSETLRTDEAKDHVLYLQRGPRQRMWVPLKPSTQRKS